MKSLRFALVLVFVSALATAPVTAGGEKEKKDKPESGCPCGKEKDSKECSKDKECCCKPKEEKKTDAKK